MYIEAAILENSFEIREATHVIWKTFLYPFVQVMRVYFNCIDMFPESTLSFIKHLLL